eukprot:UN25328
MTKPKCTTNPVVLAVIVHSSSTKRKRSLSQNEATIYVSAILSFPVSPKIKTFRVTPQIEQEKETSRSKSSFCHLAF